MRWLDALHMKVNLRSTLLELTFFPLQGRWFYTNLLVDSTILIPDVYTFGWQAQLWGSLDRYFLIESALKGWTRVPNTVQWFFWTIALILLIVIGVLYMAKVWALSIYYVNILIVVKYAPGIYFQSHERTVLSPMSPLPAWRANHIPVIVFTGNHGKVARENLPSIFVCGAEKLSTSI